MTYLPIPELPEYILAPKRGLFTVIQPEATTNLITNPSFEIDTSGYLFNAWAINIRNQGAASRGGYGVSLLHAAGNGCTMRRIVAIEADTYYTFSFDVYQTEGMTYQIWNGGNIRTWVAEYTGWYRPHATWKQASSGNVDLYFLSAASNPEHAIFIDGWQLEAKAYPTTYCDGDQEGLQSGDYRWNGIPNVSTSSRIATTRAGGRELDLLDYAGYMVTSVNGGGLSEWEPLVAELAVGHNQLFGQLSRHREVVVSGIISGKTPRETAQRRAKLVSLFRPDLTPNQQPFLVRYYPGNGLGDAYNAPLEFYCTYAGGLSGAFQNHHGERYAIVLHSATYRPYFREFYDSSDHLTEQVSWTNQDGIYQNITGSGWSQVGTAATGTTVNAVTKLADGSIVVGSDLTSWDGNTVGRVFVISPTFDDLDGGLTGNVSAVVGLADGRIVAGGSFTGITAGGTANRLAIYNGTIWNQAATGLNGAVNALALDPDGTVWVGGAFTADGGPTDRFRIAHYDPDTDAFLTHTWAVASASVIDILATADYVYVAGDFLTVNSPVDISQYVAKLNKTTGEAEYIGFGVNDTTWKIAIGPDGLLYAAGEFTEDALGNPLLHIARWNGARWEEIGGGVNDTVTALWFDNDGRLHISGAFTSVGAGSGQKAISTYAVWDGASWSTGNIAIPTAVWDAYIDDDTTYVVGQLTGSVEAAGTNGIECEATAESHVRIIMEGPGSIYSITSHTVDSTIEFDLTLSDGERAVLDMTKPGEISFRSNIRANLLSTILYSSSNPSAFRLLPGNNNIETFADSGVALFLAYRNCHHSMDATS